MCAILNKRFSLKRIEFSLKRLFNVIKLIGTNTAVFFIALQFIDQRVWVCLLYMAGEIYILQVKSCEIKVRILTSACRPH